jgi:ribosome-binding protein aMBF1 (putative translation factor)
MSITPAECKAARKLVGWSQSALATKLRLDKSAIRKRLPWTPDLIELRRVFEAAGLEFTNDDDGVRLRKNGS